MGTEDAIFDSITEATGDNFEGTGDTSIEVNPGSTVNPQNGGDVTQRQPTQSNQPAHRTPQQQNPAIRGDQAKQAQPGQASPPPEGLHRDKAGRIVDRAGNIYDDRGQLLARSGTHRNHYEQLQRNKALNQELQREVMRLSQQAAGVDKTAINGLPVKYGLTDPREIEDALRVAQMFKKDPASAVRQMLSYVVSKGINLNQIVGGEGIPNIQAEAIQRMIDSRLGPMLKKTETETQTQEVMRQGNLMAQQFLSEHPEAEPHTTDIAALSQEIGKRAQAEGRSITAIEAALTALNQLRTFCDQHGLDFKRSIPEQVEELRANQGQAPTDGRQSSPRSRRQVPMPRGNSSAGGNPVERPQRDLPANASFSDIIKSTMSELGIQ